jgi:hypothetical protein
LPVAFIRMFSVSAIFDRATPFVRWIAGFGSDRSAGESACLPALPDPRRRHHKATYLCEASARHAPDAMTADEVHRAVSKISGLQGEVYETANWITATLPRKLGNGKHAGG